MGQAADILQKNIKYLMDKSGVASVSELARQLRMQQSTLHRMLTGEVRDPKYTTLSNIAAFFQVSPIDLIERDLQQEGPHSDSLAHQAWQFHSRGVPVLGNTQLGHGGYWSDMEYPVGSGDGYLRWPSSDDDVYALKCVGDSMMPRIKEGEFVIIEPNHSYHPGDEVLVVTHGGEVMVKTFLFERDGYYHLLPVNEDHAPIRLASIDVAKIQYVAGIAKSTLWMP
ncbi:helix-turn-helix transcriptional regulator [Enterobacteriaceae bacterium BIT-l23]|jgi:phage repressor protein C with HTH and peptisase S24 domain|uniref:Helix-turn-helix transcriptional regulator n=1 Tax=Jejubacter calystegiae TaxID=2579935 RepID=A0A4P8YNI2_9ENTR|nr:S24 family peptidase [Jejubacter calystegiae]NUU68831.1 helix-turn-helix transcriptional regulator [Enterobacteriaceae bacterium BIT-l23]QCT22435.1 helix-turn-helix transcriptional regulator [Jejubacter calystegiae]